MVEKITELNTKWSPPGAQQFFEYIQAEIAKAFFVPAYLLGPEHYGIVQRRAFESTRIMAAEAERVLIEHATPVMVIKSVK